MSVFSRQGYVSFVWGARLGDLMGNGWTLDAVLVFTQAAVLLYERGARERGGQYRMTGICSRARRQGTHTR